MKVTMLGILFYCALVSLVNIDCANGKNSPNGASFKLHPGQTLQGYVVETFSVWTVLECGQRCLRNFAKCMSFNYRYGRGKMLETLCDINNTTKSDIADGRGLNEDAKSMYGEILPGFKESISAISEQEHGVCTNQPKNGLCQSKILNGNERFIYKLLEWLNNLSTWTLCWRGSRHGWKVKDFHDNCDYKGPTVTIASVGAGQSVFGGYSDKPWGGNILTSSTLAFLFSLRNKDGAEPFKSSVKHGYAQYAIYQDPNRGPTFGFANDLYICGNANVYACSEALFGSVYELPPGYVYNTPKANALLGGYRNIRLSEIETYYFHDSN